MTVPFKTDSYQIAPAETGTRYIRAEPGTGRMKFYDPSATDGITLAQLAGIAISNVYIVGTSGPGAAYTTLTAALAAAAAATAGSHLILMFPGTYNEAAPITLVTDDVTIVGLGDVEINNTSFVSPDHLLKITSGSTIPARFKAQGIRFKSTQAGKAAVYLLGGAASHVGENGIVFENCEWVTTGTALALKAESVNHIRIIGGSMKGCAGTANKIQVTTCGSFFMDGVANGSTLQLDYTHGASEPYDTSFLKYKVKSSTLAGLSSTLTTDGELEVDGCDGDFTTEFYGTQHGRFLGSRLGAVTVGHASETVHAIFDGTSYTSLTIGDSATNIVSEPLLTGTATLDALATTKAVSLPYKQPDTNYAVTVGMGTAPIVAGGATTKGTTSFTVTFSSADAGARSFDWVVSRVVKE